MADLGKSTWYGEKVRFSILKPKICIKIRFQFIFGRFFVRKTILRLHKNLFTKRNHKNVIIWNLEECYELNAFNPQQQSHLFFLSFGIEICALIHLYIKIIELEENGQTHYIQNNNFKIRQQVNSFHKQLFRDLYAFPLSNPSQK